VTNDKQKCGNNKIFVRHISEKKIFSKFPYFASEKPVISKLCYRWTGWHGKNKKFSVSQIKLYTWYKKPIVDISDGVWVIMLTKVGSPNKKATLEYWIKWTLKNSKISSDVADWYIFSEWFLKEKKMWKIFILFFI
jgi:hypothetical protein